MGRSAKNRKRAISTPCGTKTRQPMKTKFGRGDRVGGSTVDGRNIFGGSLNGGAPTRWPFVKLLWFCSSLFPEPANRSDTTFAYHILCIKRRGFFDTRAFWGKSRKISHFGVSDPKPPTFAPHLNLRCRITFKRWEIDKKWQWNVDRNRPLAFIIC